MNCCRNFLFCIEIIIYDDFILDLPATHFSNSRVYDAQVVEIRDDLSLIILMSTADEVNILSTSSVSHLNSPPSSSSSSSSSAAAAVAAMAAATTVITNQRISNSSDHLNPFMYLPVYIFEVCE